MAYGIQNVATGEWLSHYDPDGGPHVYPTGTMTWTADPAAALHFTTAASALVFWRQPSRRTPVRPDGKPNRPLTAFTVGINPLPP